MRLNFGTGYKARSYESGPLQRVQRPAFQAAFGGVVRDLDGVFPRETCGTEVFRRKRHRFEHPLKAEISQRIGLYKITYILNRVVAGDQFAFA